MKEKRIEILIIGLFAFLTIFVFRDYFLAGRVPFPANFLVSFFQPWASYEFEGVISGRGLPHKHLNEDNLRIFYPLRKLAIDEMRNFNWPLWNPYSFSGNTHLATYQTAVFHPLSFLFFILPQIDAWSIIIIFQPFLLSIFMYLFLREIYVGRKASVFGAIAFAFSGFMVVWFEESFMSGYSALFLPFILYAMERMFKKVSGVNFLLLVLGLTFSLLSGWFQMTMYTWTFALFWAVFRFVTNRRRKSFLFTAAAGYIVALLVCAAYLIPNIEAYGYSVRGSADVKYLFDNYLLGVTHLITFIASDFFGNPASYNYFGGNLYHEKIIFVSIVPLLFALYEMLTRGKNTRGEVFFKSAWLITFSLGFALPTSWFLLYHLKLPFISVMLPSRIFFLSTFCICVLAAFGLERYLSEKIHKKKLFFACFLIGLGLLIAWGVVVYNRIYHLSENIATVSLRNLILPSGFFLSCLIIVWVSVFKQRVKSYAYIGLLTIAFISAFYFSNKYLDFSQRSLVFPETPVLSKLQKISGIDRVWSFGKGHIERNFLTYYRLFSPEGYDSIYIERYGELLYAAENNGIVADQIPRVDARLKFAERVADILADPYRKRLLSLLGVRYIVEKKGSGVDNTEKGEEPNFRPIWDDGIFIIYEFLDAYPRFFLANDYKVLTKKQDIVHAIFDNAVDLTKTIILEKEPKGIFKNTQTNNDGVVQLDFYKTKEVTFSVRTKQDSLLFISDSYYPGWKAYVDAEETEIYRADYSFRAVVIPEGNHRVVFRYEPLSFTLGLVGSSFGLLFLGVTMVKIWKKA